MGRSDMASEASPLANAPGNCAPRNQRRNKSTQCLKIFECLIACLTECPSVCASLECLSVVCLLLCLVFPSERGAVGTSRRADVGGELQQRGGGAGEDVHVIAVCLLPTRREGRAPPFPIHPLPSTSASIRKLHLYPRPPPLRSTSTSTLRPHLYPRPPHSSTSF